MKKIIYFFVALLCTFSKVNAQTEYITFPVEGSVFQMNGAGNYKLRFGGQLQNTNPMFYMIEKRNGNSSWQNIVKDVTISSTALSTTSTNAINRLIFKENSSIDLAKGWYRICLYRKYSNWFGLNVVRKMKHIVQFGVGDVYFVAGQSNASGRGSSNYDLQGTPSGDNAISTIGNNINSNPMARVFDSKQDEQMIINGLNNPQKSISLSLPYKSTFKAFDNGLNINPTIKKNNPLGPNGIIDRISMYPNGYNSWYWAPLAHKLANPTNSSNKYLGTPTLWFNCASPGTSLQDNGLDLINIWNVINTINTSSRANFLNRVENETLRGKFKQTLQTYAGAFGAKAVLWHQGEADHEQLLANNPYMSVAGYKTQLENLIDFSRLAATGSSTNSSLAWYISKASLLTREPNQIGSPVTTQSTSGPLLGYISGKFQASASSLTWTSPGLRNNQTSTKTNVFDGPNTDLIDNSTPNNLRASQALIHFSGPEVQSTANLSSLQTAADLWYSALQTPTVSTLPPGDPIPITNVVKNGNNNFTVTVVDQGPGSEYI